MRPTEPTTSAQVSRLRSGAAGRPVIVVGLDDSPTSWDAFAWATGEALRTNGALVAVHVMRSIYPVAFGVPYDYAAAAQARRDIAEALRDEARKRVCDLGVRLTFVQAQGDPAYALARVARLCNADLIVVGRSTKILHHFVGSLGRRLMAKRDTPVVAVVP